MTEKHIDNEKDLQNFIAEHPWLLNSNYVKVPELRNGDVEIHIGGQKRIDLVLKNNLDQTPVIVEFKHGAAYRENIGQIMEYKSRVIAAFAESESPLTKAFGKKILSPKAVLVVKECDDYFRTACNLSGIDIYEYKNLSQDFSDPARLKNVEALLKEIKEHEIPLKDTRYRDIEEKIPHPIYEVLSKNGFGDAFFRPKKSRAYYWEWYSDLFLNRWFFPEEEISIGVYEDLFESQNICIAFFSWNIDKITKFANEYKQKTGIELREDPWMKQNSRSHSYSPGDFLENVAEYFGKELDIYKELYLGHP